MFGAELTTVFLFCGSLYDDDDDDDGIFCAAPGNLHLLGWVAK
jgi:hypothetical protein